MSLLTIIIIALGLSMDAFAVSVASGCALRQMRVRHALRMALAFGVFQAAMPIAGWFAGFRLREIICGVDHWIAFLLLAFVGGKMIYEATKLKPKEARLDPGNLKVLLALSIATSIDAFAVGLSLSFLKVAIVSPSLIIGVVTFLLSFLGVYIGKKIGHIFESKIEIFGGVILIAIGLKILIEHLK